MNDMNINELIYLYFLKDEEALQLIISYFRPMVTKIIRSKQAFSSRNDGWFEDKLALADTVLIDCLHAYRPDQNVVFAAFYKQALLNRLIDEGKYDVRHQVKYHYETIALDQKIQESTTTRYADVIADPKTRERYSYKLKEILDALEDRSLFTEEEASVLKMRMHGYTQQEIADSIGKSTKYVRKIFANFRKWYTEN